MADQLNVAFAAGMPTAAIPASFLNALRDVLLNLEVIGGELRRNGLQWRLEIGPADAQAGAVIISGGEGLSAVNPPATGTAILSTNSSGNTQWVAVRTKEVQVCNNGVTSTITILEVL